MRDSSSFTRRNFDDLQALYESVHTRIQQVANQLIAEDSNSAPGSTSAKRLDSSRDLKCEQIRYWNEYDDGSECGNDEYDNSYVIYVNPEDDGDGDWARARFQHLARLLKLPYDTARAWFVGPRLVDGEAKGHDDYGDSESELDLERNALLPGETPLEQDPHSASSAYGAVWMLPGPRHQQQSSYYPHYPRYRLLIASGSLACALVLLLAEGFMISAGNPALDGIVAVIASIGVVLAALGLWVGTTTTASLRHCDDGPSVEGRLMGWAVFLTVVVLNVFVLMVAGCNLAGYERLWGLLNGPV